MLSTDARIFESGSTVSKRMVEYGDLFNELHVVVYTEQWFRKKKLSGNVFIYPTNTQFKLFYFWGAYGICEKILKSDKNFVVTSQDAMTNILALLLRLQFKFFFQVQIHTDFLSPYFRKESLKNFIRYVGYCLSVRYADCIRVVSKRAKDSLVSKFHTPYSKIKVLPIFVDIEKIKNTSITVDLHKKYPQFDFIVLMVSRLTREKNIHLAIQALKDVVIQYPKTGLVIFGDGPKKKKLELQAISYKLQANIVFEGWVDDVISYYKTADIYLLTSNYEGYGMALIEAAASGCPIVTTDVGVVGDILMNNESVLVCGSEDISCLVRNIVALEKSKELREQLARSASRAVIRRAISKQEYLQQFITSLQSCLSKNKKK